MKLKDKVAIITGASKGIGKAIAVAFAKEGANLCVNYLRQTEEKDQQVLDELQRFGVKVTAVPGDISKEETVKRLVDQAIRTFGRIDILVTMLVF